MFLISPICATCPAHLIFLGVVVLTSYEAPLVMTVGDYVR